MHSWQCDNVWSCSWLDGRWCCGGSTPRPESQRLSIRFRSGGCVGKSMASTHWFPNNCLYTPATHSQTRMRNVCHSFSRLFRLCHRSSVWTCSFLWGENGYSGGPASTGVLWQMPIELYDAELWAQVPVKDAVLSRHPQVKVFDSASPVPPSTLEQKLFCCWLNAHL